MNKTIKEPLLLKKNRIMRFYVGGKKIDKWQRCEIGEDSNMCEDMLVTTSKYIGPGHPDNNGYSMTEVDGETTSLKALIDADEKTLLGEKYVGRTFGQSGILCRVGDTIQRLVLQYHPTDEFAQKYFKYPYGKTESWYIVDTRDDGDNYCYAGFKKGVTREAFEKLFFADDIEGMLNCVHKIHFKKGDSLLIKSGTVHAMGPDTTFIEFHQPCDYTMRIERNYMDNHISDEDLHYGLGFEALFDGLDFTTYTYEEMCERVICKQPLVDENENGKRYSLLSPEKNKQYSEEKVVINGRYKMPEVDGHYIIIAAKNDTTLVSENSRKVLKQGFAAFIPASVSEVTLESDDSEVVVGYPFK